jgi:two-component system, sensor histidine kinase and response regulator
MVIAAAILAVFVVLLAAGVIAQAVALRRRATPYEQAARGTRQRRRRYRAGDVVLICRPDLVISQAEPTSLFLLGYPPEALAGKSLNCLVHAEDSAALGEFGRLLTTSGPDTVAIRCHHRDGSWVWFEAAVRREPWPVAIEVVARDVEDRIRAQQWLAARHGLADAVLSLASDAVIGTDSQARIVAWNRGAETMLGLRREDVIGRDVAETVIPAASRERYRDAMRSLWEPDSAGRVDQPTEAVALRRDGTELAVEATAWIVDIGQTRQLTTLIRDVSARRQALESMVDARDQALEASRLKSEFLATTGHAIRTPMNGIIRLTDRLLETDLDQNQRRYGEGIRTAGAALLKVVNDVLDYSKLESGRVAIEEIDFDLRELVEDVVALVAETGRDKAVELVGYCAPELPVALRGDPARLRQVLLNLADNAVKFTDRGEVVIRANWAVGATEKPESASVRFEVADTGIGIAREDLERLFDAFAEPVATNRPGSSGAGLGLAISNRLVEAMGGRLTVDSEPDRGSTFAFELSLRRQGRGRPPVPSEPDDLAGLRVLVVDDNVSNRIVLEGQIRAWRMVPVAVDSAAAARDVLREATSRHRPYDVTILDTTISGNDGLNLAREITADATIGSVHVVLLTPDSTVDSSALRAAGVGSWLTKPVHQSALFRSLAQALVPSDKLSDEPVPLLANDPTRTLGSTETAAPAAPAVPAVPAVPAAPADGVGPSPTEPPSVDAARAAMVASAVAGAPVGGAAVASPGDETGTAGGGVAEPERPAQPVPGRTNRASP